MARTRGAEGDELGAMDMAELRRLKWLDHALGLRHDPDPAVRVVTHTSTLITHGCKQDANDKPFISFIINLFSSRTSRRRQRQHG
mgnify:CR=1 FL=1